MSEVESKQQLGSKYSLQVDCTSALNFVLQRWIRKFEQHL